MNPDVNVGIAPEIPDERRPFHPPVVPLPFLVESVFPVKNQMALAEPTLLLQAFQDPNLEYGAKKRFLADGNRFSQDR